MISSLEDALALLQSSIKQGKLFCLALSDESSSFWFSAGLVLSVNGAKFTFSTAGGEPVVATINLGNCEFVNQKPSEAPTIFQPSMERADVPVIQARLKSGRLLEMFEEDGNQ